MGSYAECRLESLYVGSTKNDIDPALIQLFRAGDKRVDRGAWRELSPRTGHLANEGEDDADKISLVSYAAPSYIIKDRLDLKGYTLATAKMAFLKHVHAQAKEYSEWAKDDMEDFYKRRVNLLSAIDAYQWLAGLRNIKESGLGKGDSWNLGGDFDGTLIDYMLKNDWFGYSGADIFVPLRLALEICADSDNLIYDLTDLILGGYFSAEDDFISIASGIVAGEHSSSSKIVLLTEGNSDRWIISQSMELLYPHLFDYFTFMDFEGARVEGGAGPLAGNVKSFAGAGIANKVIALFDNDTAGESALRSLRQIQLPENIRVMQLPRLEGLSCYPTIGPSGTIMMDVNGMAAGIEMYLGVDVLTEGNALTPVQWTGYNAALSKYQGEVLNKDRIHARFREKIRACARHPERIDSECWLGLRAILSSIFSAFHAFDRELIFAELESNYSRY